MSENQMCGSSDQRVSGAQLQGCSRLPVAKRRRSVRVPFRWLLCGGAGIGIVAGLSICLAGNYVNIVLRQARDSYVVYRLSSERDELRATRDRLERELSTMRIEHGQASNFEVVVKHRLDELNSVVEASASLGLVKKEKRVDQPLMAKNDLRPSESETRGNETALRETSELASLLDSPALRTRSGRGEHIRRHQAVDELRSINKGLGGAEVECRKDSRGKVVCASTVSKENVAFSDVRASLKPLLLTLDQSRSWQSDWSGEQKDLFNRLTSYTSILRSMPIGAPVLGEYTSGFGYRMSPFTNRSSFHEGIDISLDRGTRVRSPGDGVVVKVDFDGTYGWMVDVAHSATLVTRYAHLTRAIVKEGQAVRRGQVLALSGSTGRSTGPHLHYEVRVNGRAKNPMPYIALASKLARVVS